MQPVDSEAFEKLVVQAIDSLPEAFLEMLDNVVILIEDVHPTDHLLGLYEGVPHTERGDYGDMALPDRVTLYRLALCEFAEDEAMLAEEVQITVVHELAHHFGIDDDRLHELGWD